MTTAKNFLILVLCIALLITCGFYLILTGAGNGSPAVAEPDVILYFQYAKNIAAGHFYVFSPGDAPSTGSTSYLYPLLLSFFYRFGVTDDGIITAALILNSLFYLSSVVLMWYIARRFDTRIAPLVAFLTVLSGHTASAVLRQTDIGLFTFLTLATVTSLLYSRYYLTAVLIALCSLTRPEGFIFSLAFIACGGLGLILNKKYENTPTFSRQCRFFLFFGFIGVVFFALLLAINYYMTGYFQFMSVANKGYIKVYPFFGAIERTLTDALDLYKGVFFGLSPRSRQFYLIPLIAGALGFAGIMLYPRTDKSVRLCECWILLSAGASLALIASSQWQGVSNDRYLGWIIPLWLIYIAVGVYEISDRVNARYFLPVCSGLLIVFQVASLGYMASNAYVVAVAMDKEKAFAGQIKATLPAGQTLGSTSGGSLNFYLPEYKVYNLCGITSPDFFRKNSQQQILHVIDLIKHQPQLRFTYWLVYMNFLERHEWAKPFFGDLVLLDTDSAIASPWSYAVYTAKWDSLEGGLQPRLLEHQLENRSLVDHLDIGYLDEEQKHNYRCRLRLKNVVIPPVLFTADLDSKPFSEVGRVVVGSESFVLHSINPGKDLYIVLRTARTASGKIYYGGMTSQINKLEFDETLKLKLFVDAVEIPVPPQKLNSEGYSEMVLHVPAVALQGENPHIIVGGDHISFAYWFYQ